MTSEEQKIIDIRVNYKDAINSIVQLEKSIKKMKDTQDQLDKQLSNHTITQAQYNKQMEASKAAIRDYNDSIRALRKEVQNNLKQEKLQEGSLKQLRAELSNAVSAYDSLSRAERESAKGADMVKHIQQISNELKEAEALTNRFQRNVGNYASGWDGLGMSVQQILRELPSAAVSLNTFFLAISNNIPMLVDQINLLRAANKAAAAEGKATVSIWKSLSSALFSWNTAITLAVTALTFFGGKIIEWVGNLIKGKEGLDSITKSQKEFAEFVKKSNEEWTQNVAETAGRQIAEYQKLSREYDALGDNMAAKKKFIDENQTAFHNLGFSVTGVSDAENLLVKNTNAVVNAIIARAKAAAYEQEIMEATQRYIRNTERNRGTVEGGGYYERVKAGKNWGTTGEIPEELRDLIEGVDYTKMSSGTVASFTLTAAGAAKINAKLNKEAAERLKKNNEEERRQLDAVVKNATEGLKEQTEAQQKIYEELGLHEYTGTGGKKKGKKDRTKQVNEANLKIAEELYKSQTDLITNEAAKQRKVLQDTYNAEVADLRNKQKNDKDLTAESRDAINQIILNKEKKLQQDISALDLEEQRKLQDVLIGLIADEYDQRREMIKKQYDRQIEDLQNQLNNSKGLTIDEMDSLTTQILALQDQRFKALEALSNEQMQKDIQDEINRTETRIQLAKDGTVEELNLQMQKLEQERELRKLQAQQQITDQEELRQALLLIDQEYDAKAAKAEAEATAVQIATEQKKWQAVTSMASAASQFASEIGENDKTLTALSKTLALATVAINTGVAISKAIAAAAGNPLGFLQIASIVSQVLTAMATATSIIKSAKFARGGYVAGQGTGTSDSIPARLSNGESVMTAKATSMFSPLLSTFNQLGGGVPITVNTTAASVGEDFLAAAVAKGFMMCPAPVVSVEEISRVQKRVQTIRNISRL